ncbi:MAG TPA: SSI family serine proteinase inhibitor [Streptosporangiaceae bacterium]|nr:SSI family serine proteinase inhibitor [Streptosporangiaceae bacterium]
MSSDTPRAHCGSRLQLTTARCLTAVAGVALVALVAACGTAAAPGSGTSPAPAKASLHITVQNGPGVKPTFWTLRCDPAGGTHPHPATACSALMSMKEPFAPPPAHQMCPMMLASARRVSFTGTWFGAKVDRTIVDGGCDLARWAKLGQVVN